MNQRTRRRTTDRELQISIDTEAIGASLALPEAASGLVLFAHGSGSSRFSPRNRHVAQVLNGAGLATLLLDLLTMREEQVDSVTREFRFNIELLARRLMVATRYCSELDETRMLPQGYFGASTGAAAALIAAAESTVAISAIVSRGGRPDLAERVLRVVQAPTLLIVGGNDRVVLDLNRRALELLPGTKALEVVPGASHLFEEPGALENVAQLAGDWFVRYLTNGHALH
jgi:pimeloyl-ACP methyl ester carboxylesterase